MLPRSVMKLHTTMRSLVCALALAAAPPLLAHGSAFLYQGLLSGNGTNVTGLFDFRFALYDAATGGTLLAGPVTNTAVPVAKGLFSTSVDFDAGAFTGADVWLDLAVSINGAGQFTSLTPRQPLLP